MKLGPNIRALLDEKGMSQSELAARAHVEVDYMNAIMHADMDQNGPLPLKAMIMRIADVLGVSIDALLNPEGKGMQRPTNDGHVKCLCHVGSTILRPVGPFHPGLLMRNTMMSLARLCKRCNAHSIGLRI